MSVDDYLTLVYRNLTGEISSEDFARLNRLTAQKEEYAIARSEYEAMWDATSDDEQIVTAEETEDLFKRLTGEKSEAGIIVPLTRKEDSDPTEINSTSSRTSWSTLKVMSRIASIAAILLLAIGAWFVFQTSTTVYDTPGVYTLADQSEVTLRHGTLTVSKFDNSQRKVALDGEALFKISRDVSRPFLVNSDHVKIEVLGTEFLVKEAGDETFIQLYEGKISTTDIRSLDTRILTAGMNVRHTVDGEIVDDSNNNNLSVWNKGVVQYRNITLQKAIEELSFIYEQEILIEDELMRTCTITAVINGKALIDILEKISSSFEMNVDTTGNTLKLKGGACE